MIFVIIIFTIKPVQTDDEKHVNFYRYCQKRECPYSCKKIWPARVRDPTGKRPQRGYIFADSQSTPKSPSHSTKLCGPCPGIIQNLRVVGLSTRKMDKLDYWKAGIQLSFTYEIQVVLDYMQKEPGWCAIPHRLDLPILCTWRHIVGNDRNVKSPTRMSHWRLERLHLRKNPCLERVETELRIRVNQGFAYPLNNHRPAGLISYD